MEKDVEAAQGIMRAMYEKFYDDSDGCSIYICRRCRRRAIVNEKQNIVKCMTCEDLADVAKVASSWAVNLMFNEFNAMGVDMEFNLKSHEFTSPEYFKNN